MKKQRFKYIAIGVFSTLVIGVATLAGLDALFPLDIHQKTWATLVTARDGTPLRAFADKNGVWRYPVEIKDVSPLYLSALLTYEDQWFYHHPGINPFAFIRAFGQNLMARQIISGGSTLTMQVARMLHPTKRTLGGKWLQILRALQLEYHLTKDEILSLYLNMAPFGANIEGVQTACFTWLGKQVNEISHAEAALLAVLPQAPSFHRPDRHPDRARKARDKVLDRMEKFKVWTKTIVVQAKKEPVTAQRFVPPMTAPLAARRLFFKYPDRSHIATTLDYDLQVHLKTIVHDYVSGLSQDQSAAVLVVNHRSLDTIAYVGSADFSSVQRKGHVDMITAIRSPGSTLKPFLYGLAMDKGLIHSHSLLMDTPRYQKEYDPGNFSKGFSGPVTMADALRLSLNVPAVQVLEHYSPQVFYDQMVHAGARLKLSGRPNLSMVLGGVGTNLESLVRLYTAIVRGGLTGKPRLLATAPLQERYLMSQGAAWIISQILSHPMPGFEGVNRLAGHTPMAWKTGTSYGFRDAWAIGIMGEYVAGVWVGRPDGSPSVGQYGASTAIPLLRRVFDSLPLSDFHTPQPSGVSKQTICWPLGLPQKETKNHCFVRHDAWILDNKIPMTLNRTDDPFSSLLKTFWVDKNGLRAQPSCGGIKKVSTPVWPQGAGPWIPKRWKAENLLPEPSPNCPNIADIPGNRMRITSLSDKSVLTRPPEQQNRGSIPLNALGSRGKTYWFLNREPIATLDPGSSGTLPMPMPGNYQMCVADDTGRYDVIHFSVIGLK